MNPEQVEESETDSSQPAGRHTERIPYSRQKPIQNNRTLFDYFYYDFKYFTVFLIRMRLNIFWHILGTRLFILTIY